MKTIRKILRYAETHTLVAVLVIILSALMIAFAPVTASAWTINGMDNDNNHVVGNTMGWGDIPWVANEWDPDQAVTLVGEITASSTKTIAVGNAVALGDANNACVFTINSNATITFDATTLTNLAEPEDLTIGAGSTLTTGALTINCSWTMSSGTLAAANGLITPGDVELQATATFASLEFQGGNASLTINNPGKVFTVTGELVVNVSTFNLTAGSVIVGSVNQHVGGSMNINGGTFTCNGDLVNNATLNVNSGVLRMGGAITSTVAVNVKNGLQEVEEEVQFGGSILFYDDAVDSYIHVDAGTFLAQGTWADKVVISSETDEPGQWGNIYSSGGDVDISYAKIYGGGDAGQNFNGSGMIRVNGGNFDVSHSELYNSETEAVLVVAADEADISTSSIHDAGTGIEIIDTDTSIISNNFIYDVDAEGILLDDNSVPIGVRNNFVFNCGHECIWLDGSSGANIVYNTLFNPGQDQDASCVLIDGGGANVKIYNNLLWGYHTDNGNGGIRADAGGAVRAVDYNGFEDQLAGSAYVGLTSPGGGPYTNETWTNDPITSGKHDFTDFRFESSVAPYDFHIYGWTRTQAAGNENGIPKFVNAGYHVGEWWEGEDSDNRRNVPIADEVTTYDNNAPDLGAYAGPWCYDFVDVPISDQVYDITHINDPYILVKGDKLRQPPSTSTTQTIPEDYYFISQSIEVASGTRVEIAAGSGLHFDEVIGIDVYGGFKANGTEDSPINFTADEGVFWDGLSMYSTTDNVNSILNFCNISNATFGVYFSGLTSGTQFTVSQNNIENCGTGIYISNSRVKVQYTNIKDCNFDGNSTGIFITTCTAGKVLLEADTISSNGLGGDVLHPGVFLTNASPELVYNIIENNSGAGIYCSGSYPDLNTFYSATDHPNTIRTNGDENQDQNNGPEIYLTGSSYPVVQYNNIYDGVGAANRVGVMISKDGDINHNNRGYLTATNNWWGDADPGQAFFFWGDGDTIAYNPHANTFLNSVNDFDLAMDLWDDKDYVGAAELFRECVADSGSVGVQAIHMLAGCVAEMENGDPNELRTFLLDVADTQVSSEVARVAKRFAINCLTMQGRYLDAMYEYDQARLNATSLSDSVSAIVDYLACAELAGEGKEVNMVNNGASIQSQIHNALKLLANSGSSDKPTTSFPETFSLTHIYPNPFNNRTSISYNLAEATDLMVAIFDVEGREVALLHNGRIEAGIHQLTWDASNAAAGAYFCRFELGGEVKTFKLTLVK